jgi:hypothetical protein
MTIVIVTRKTGGDAALIAASELAGLMETAQLLHSPKNAHACFLRWPGQKREKESAGRQRNSGGT